MDKPAPFAKKTDAENPADDKKKAGKPGKFAKAFAKRFGKK